MRRKIDSPFFMFNGALSTDMGVELLSMPTRFFAGKNGDKLTVPGRSGYLWQDDDTWDYSTVKTQVIIPDNANLDAVAAWLAGDGLLIFSDEPNRAWHARGVKEISRSSKSARLEGQTFMIIWDCQPFRYVYPEPDPITLDASGDVIDNEGTVYALPVITVEASGDYELFVNGYQIDQIGLADSHIIDCDAQECTSTDGTELLNSYFEIDEFPRLDPGPNIVTWSGGITAVTFSCPWRYL